MIIIKSQYPYQIGLVQLLVEVKVNGRVRLESQYPYQIGLVQQEDIKIEDEEAREEVAIPLSNRVSATGLFL